MLLKEGDLLCFDDIVVQIRELPAYLRRENHKQSCHRQQVHLVKDRFEICFRSTMRQERFSNLAILNSHKERTEQLFLVDIANEFSDRNSYNRKRNLASFKDIQ